MPYYIINEVGDEPQIWPILCSSFEQALGHVLNKINEMNKEFRKENPEWQSVDPEYYMAKMEDDCCITKAKEPRGTLVANFCDYKVQIFVKEVHLKTSD